jgi:hypothetical protein
MVLAAAAVRPVTTSTALRGCVPAISTPIPKLVGVTAMAMMFFSFVGAR